MSYLKISNVSKSYVAGENVYQALKNINLEFNKNEFVAILGESGSGKSTLLNLIIGISDISKGNIYFKNENIKNFSSKRMDKYRKKEIGIIFQKYNLIDAYNMYDNLAVIKEKNIGSNKINKLLVTIDMLNKKKKKIYECSGGENQRVAAIRSIVNNPSIVICDEPTGALDKENSEKLMDYLLGLRMNRLVLFVTHNKELAYKYATRIISLKDGEVIEDLSLKNKEELDIDFDNEYDDKSNFKFIYKMKFVTEIIKKKKGRFMISILSMIFLLFFICISLMAINVTNDYIYSSFLSSLDANIIDLKSYKYDDKTLKETNISPLIIDYIKSNDYDIRINYNNYLYNELINNIEFKANNKKINLSNIIFSLTSNYSKKTLKYGEYPKSVNEVIINENLYNYLKNDESNIINQKMKIISEFNSIKELKIKGVSNSSLMNSELIIYFDYSLINELLKDKKINEYQLDVKNIDNIRKIINDLQTSNFYIPKEDINGIELNFSLVYSSDLDNYNTFYELIRLAKFVIYFFLILSTLISVMLLSNVLYSFIEEERKNLAILKILGFSYLDISYLPIILSIIVSLLSYLIIIIFNTYIIKLFEPSLSDYLSFKVDLSLGIVEYIFILIIIIIFSFISSAFPIIKLRFLKLDEVLKEE